jgi:AhpD family alkylhydroperoxidase
MTRIASLPVEQWDSELRELAQASTLPTVQQRMLGVYANAPALAKPFLIFTGAMSQGFTLRRRLLELVRLRIAFHNQCRSCMSVRYESALQDGLTEDLVCSLEKPMEAPGLTDAEKMRCTRAPKLRRPTTVAPWPWNLAVSRSGST